MSTTISNPYVGPRPFKKDEANRFFGRDREARDLLALVSSQRLVLFYASSGAGKSSLINARLLDALIGRGFEVLPVGRVTGVLPREADADLSKVNVFAYFLKQSLAEYALASPMPEADVQFFREYAGASLSEFLLRLAHAGQDKQGNDRYVFTTAAMAGAEVAPAPSEDAPVELKPRALIVDQFEEVFTTNLQAWEQRGDFFSQIRQAMEDDPYLWVVLAMREDFIANLDPLAHLLPGELHARFYMQRMGYDAALDAVKKPVENKEHPEWYRPFAAGVAEKLVNNLRQVHVTTEEGEGVATAKGEFIEPVQLQVVCYQLWEQLRDTPGEEITDADLDRLAGGQDLSAFIDRALGEFYEQALRRVLEKAGSHVSEMELRRWFSERLITEAGTRGFVYRGESETGGLPNEVVRLIAAEFLIRSESRAGGTWYELSHDRFVDPIQRSNQRWSLEQLQRDPLLRRAHEWAASNPTDPVQRDQRLLLTDEELAALELGSRTLEPVMHDFLEASQQAKKDRDLAAAQQKEQAALRRERATRRRLLVIAGLMVLALLASVVAASQAIRAGIQTRAARYAEATAVAAQATSEANADVAEIARQQADAALKDAEVANQIARSLELANQSLDASSIEDALLLARVATTYSPTLLANTALLDALDDGYRLESGARTVFVPPAPLDFAAGGPWEKIAFSHDGALMALSDGAGGITLWDNAAGQPIGERLLAHGDYPVSTLAFDPTGPRLASATGNRENPMDDVHDLLLWDLSDPEQPVERVLAANLPSIWSVAWSADGQTLAVANEDGTIDLWESLTGSTPISRTLPGRHADWAYSVAFSPDGGRLASAGRDGRIILWSDIASSTPLSQTLAEHTARVNVAAFSPDGALLASGSDDGTLRLWDLTADPITGVVRDNRYDQSIEVWDLAFTADGETLAASWGDSMVRVYDLTQPDAAPWELAGHQSEVNAVAFDPAAPQRLVSLGVADDAPIAWDLGRGSEFVTAQLFTAPISATLRSVSAAGRWLAVSGDNKSFFVGDTLSRSPAISFTTALSVTAMALSPDGGRLALAECEPVQGPAMGATQDNPSPDKTPDPAQQAAPGAQQLPKCRVALWPLNAGQPLAPVQVISFTQPVAAIAFHSQSADELALGLASGQVVRYNLAAAEAANLPRPVPEIVDLAFAADGSKLAALGSGGLIKIWDWSNQQTLSERTLEHNDTSSQFDAIEFMADDVWLAIATNAPDLEIWEWDTWTRVEKTGPEVERYTDLAYDVAGQTLLAVQPGGVLRWPMDQARWKAMACARARRNLSYDAWRVAFPAADIEDTADARVCDFPLDSSFADALVQEAQNAIAECTDDGLAAGMEQLTTARMLDVSPPLRLDPLAFTMDVLGEKALENLRQPSGQYDVQAEACLQLAVQQLAAAGEPAFDAQLALAAGRNLVQAEEHMADPQADAGPVVDELEEILEVDAPWPNDFLYERTQALLPDAYYRLCQQGDEVGCQRFAAAAEMVEYGDTVAGEYQSGVEAPIYFQGQRGEAVTIVMNAVNNAFDTLVRLEGYEGELASNDDNGVDRNSLIPAFMLPRDGIYRIIPSAYSGEGGYRLSLQVSFPQTIAVGDADASTTAQDSLWRFDGQAGQLVAISLEAAESGFDPYLTLFGPDLVQLEVNDDSGWNNNALIVVSLPEDGSYYINTGRPGSNTPYTLRVFEPRPLPFDQPQTSTVVSDTLWAFDGTASQVVNLTISPPLDDMTPRLSLLDPSGWNVASGVASPAEGYERIPAYIVPGDGRLWVQVGPAGDAAPYTLTLTSVAPRPLVFGQPATSTTRTDPIWTFSGAAGQVVDIALNSAGATFDPELRLLDSSGGEVAYDNDGGGDLNARIAALPLPATGQYFVAPRPADRSVSYTLTLSEVAPQVIALGDTATSTVRQNVLWAFDGAAGQPINIEVAAANGETASVALWNAAGQVLTSGGQALRDWGNNTIDGYILPQTGRYLVRVGGLVPTTRYDLTVVEARTRSIRPGAVAASTVVSDTLWTVDATAGEVLDIAMSTTDPAFDPYLTIYDANGVSLTSQDSGGENLNARISVFVAPSTGRYVLRAGRPGYEVAPYTLSVRNVQPQEIALGETRRSNTRTDELWQFSGQAGQLVTIDMSGWVPNGFDPYLTLLSADGERLAENDDIAPDNYNARIAGFLLPQTGVYYLQTGRPGSASSYSLSIRTRAATSAVPDSRLQVTQSGAYALAIDRPILVRISADQPVDLSMVGPGAEVLTGRTPAILRRLEAAGVYTLGVSMPAAAPPRWLTIERVQGTPRPVDVGTETSNVLRPGVTDFWTLAGGDQRGVRVTAAGADFIPQIELWAPGGELLAAGADVIRILPATGDSLLTVRAGEVRASGPYTLTVQPVTITPGPEACNAIGGAVDYLPVRQGSTVVLSRQRPVPGDTSWDSARNVYLGRAAQVTSLAGNDWLGCPVVYVDIDQGQSLWRVRDMAVIE